MTDETNMPVDTKKPTYLVKLVRAQKGRRSYPIKVGATFTTGKGNQRLEWDVIPASAALRESVMILVPYEQTQAE